MSTEPEQPSDAIPDVIDDERTEDEIAEPPAEEREPGFRCDDPNSLCDTEGHEVLPAKGVTDVAAH